MLSWFGQTIGTIVLIGTAAQLGFGLTVSAQDPSVASPDSPDVKWHTGRKLDEFNQLSISAWWSDAELRERLIAFANQQKAAIFLDRRIDPSTRIDVGMNGVTPEQFLWAVGDKYKMGVCRIDDFYYFGPPESAAALPHAIKELNERTGKGRRGFKVDWHRKQPLKQGTVCAPKQLLQKLATENGFTIKNLEAVPHDVWARFELPPTSLDNRVAILLVGFGKWFERSSDGTEIEIIDFPSIKSGEIVASDITDLKQSVRRYRDQFPGLTISSRGKRLVATGPPKGLAALRLALVQAQSATHGDNATRTFTLTTKASRGSILATIANQTGTQLQIDTGNESLKTNLQEQIEVRVNKVGFDQLMAETLKGTNLKYETGDGRLKILEK